MIQYSHDILLRLLTSMQHFANETIVWTESTARQNMKLLQLPVMYRGFHRISEAIFRFFGIIVVVYVIICDIESENNIQY